MVNIVNIDLESLLERNLAKKSVSTFVYSQIFLNANDTKLKHYLNTKKQLFGFFLKRVN